MVAYREVIPHQPDTILIQSFEEYNAVSVDDVPAMEIYAVLGSSLLLTIIDRTRPVHYP